ncbi:gp53-like domain-containing protein [Escherichia coli]|uniref:gp53-like domain-containing protein n=1 Tax=Escherichia coli TaxID=562 RepID=UPI001FCEEB55|nr:phage tail protein [Escherichia coli]
MATNNFKPFATAANANVTAQADWEALPALLSGFMAGKASSAQVNKAIRQASFIAAALAQYTANKSGLDVLDDGDLNGFISKMRTAFGKDFQALDATLTALAGLATGANKLPYFTGNDTAAQTDLTSVGRDIIGKSTIADILTYLQLGKAAKRDVGTGSNQIPDMSSFSTGTTSSGRWAKLPSGLIIQAGTGLTGSAGTASVTLPIPFTGTFFVVGGSIEGNGPIFVSARGLSQSTIGVVAWGRDGSIQVTNMHWVAIGV